MRGGASPSTCSTPSGRGWGSRATWRWEEGEGVSQAWRCGRRARKRIHNELMELKGNIRVFCRVRPLDEAHEGGQQEAVRVVNDMTLQAMSDKGPSHGYRSFDFDCVFGPDSTQEGVFEEVQHLVTSAMDGFNVCILAYGQTGSGKTHTMEGPSSDPGVNMRALDLLFQVPFAAPFSLARVLFLMLVPSPFLSSSAAPRMHCPPRTTLGMLVCGSDLAAEGCADVGAMVASWVA